MRNRLTLLAAVVTALLSLVLATSGGAATGRTVSVRDDYFGPKTMTVHKGTRVTWVWKGYGIHNVHATKGPGTHFRSKTKSSGKFSWGFTRTGTYRVVCTIHAPDMHMTINVVR